MPDHSRPPPPFHALPSVFHEHIRTYIKLPADHPAKISSRTYGLALLLSLGPALLPFVAKVVALAKAGKDVDRVKVGKIVTGLGRLLRRELGPFGFAFAITTAVAGGSLLRDASGSLEKPTDLFIQNEDANFDAAGGGLNSTLKNVRCTMKRYWRSLSDVHQTFLLNSLASTTAILLLQWKTAPRRPSGIPELPLILPVDDIPRRTGISPTLNLTLILFVRALDSVVHGGLQDELLQKLKGKGREVTHRSTETEEAMSRDSVHAKNWIQKRTSNLDSLIFCVCSARCVVQASAYVDQRSLFGPRIIWCFFYRPKMYAPSFLLWISIELVMTGTLLRRLPKAYVKW
jgi:hypothetical protein